MRLFHRHSNRPEQVSLADTAAVVNTVMQLQDELAALTDEELELWLRMCGGTPSVSAYLAVLRQVRDSEQRR